MKSNKKSLIICCFLGITAKVPFFFFWNSLPPLTHSIFGIFVFVFFSLSGKKNTGCFLFFFLGKVCRPLTHLRSGHLQKKFKNTRLFPIFSHFGCYFFFPIFFFLWKVYNPLTHTILGGRKKKNSIGKKKKQHIFHSLSRF